MRIKTAHLREFLNELHKEKISFSQVVEKLNEVANFDIQCRCGNDLETHSEVRRGICTACFTSN